MVNFKDAGKFLTILLLIFQLTSCAGTFPIELVPSFFNKLYTFMPMTYSVNLFRETISGNNIELIIKDIFILLSIFVVFIIATIVFAKIKNKKSKLIKA
ncbi:ABC-2 family transporter protein [compost metagenome]